MNSTVGSVLKRASLAVGIVASSSAFATTIIIPPGGTAVANIEGCVLVNPSGVFFSGSSLCTTSNVFTPGSPDTGSYAGVTGGTIQNLVGPPQTGSVSIVDFLTFTAPGGTVHFDLTHIDPGFGNLAGCASDAVGSMCTPTGSPFTLVQQTSNKVLISLGLDGLAYLGTSASGSDATAASFSTQVVPGTITSILAAVQTPGGFQSSYSATFASVAAPAIPEPGTYILFGLGLISVASVRRRARKA
jgi:hypothetical protein